MKYRKCAKCLKSKYSKLQDEHIKLLKRYINLQETHATLIRNISDFKDHFYAQVINKDNQDKKEKQENGDDSSE